MGEVPAPINAGEFPRDIFLTADSRLLVTSSGSTGHSLYITGTGSFSPGKEIFFLGLILGVLGGELLFPIELLVLLGNIIGWEYFFFGTCCSGCWVGHFC